MSRKVQRLLLIILIALVTALGLFSAPRKANACTGIISGMWCSDVAAGVAPKAWYY